MKVTALVMRMEAVELHERTGAKKRSPVLPVKAKEKLRAGKIEPFQEKPYDLIEYQESPVACLFPHQKSCFQNLR